MYTFFFLFVPLGGFSNFACWHHGNVDTAAVTERLPGIRPGRLVTIQQAKFDQFPLSKLDLFNMLCKIGIMIHLQGLLFVALPLNIEFVRIRSQALTRVFFSCLICSI